MTKRGRPRLRLISGERYKGRCPACRRALGLDHDPPCDFVYHAETTTVAGEDFPPGWYCTRCLKRVERRD